MTDELHLMSATAVTARFKARKLSPVEIAEAAIARIDTHDPKLNAFCLVDREGAFEAARASEARWRKGKPLGPVDGVPVTVKDLALAKGWPTLRGSRFWLVAQRMPRQLAWGGLSRSLSAPCDRPVRGVW